MADIPRGPIYFRVNRTTVLNVVEFPNLLGNTLFIVPSVVPSGLVNVDQFFRVNRKPIPFVFQPPNLFNSTLAPATISGTVSVTNANDTLAASGLAADGIVRVFREPLYIKVPTKRTIFVFQPPNLLGSVLVSNITGAINATNNNDILSALGDTTALPFFSSNVLSSAPTRVKFVAVDASRGIPKVLYLDDVIPSAYIEILPVHKRPLRGLSQQLGSSALLLAFQGTPVSGTINKSNSNDTLVAAGTTTVIGNGLSTNTNDTLAAQDVLTGTLAYTNNNDTLAAIGSPVIRGTISVNNNNDTSEAAGTLQVNGTLDKTNNNDVASIMGLVGNTSGNSGTKRPTTGAGN